MKYLLLLVLLFQGCAYSGYRKECEHLYEADGRVRVKCIHEE